MQSDDAAVAGSVRCDDSAIVELEEMRPGHVHDFNRDDEVVEIEVARVHDRVPHADLTQRQVEVT